MTESTAGLCVCGAPMGSTDCLLRAHLNGPQPAPGTVALSQAERDAQVLEDAAEAFPTGTNGWAPGWPWERFVKTWLRERAAHIRGDAAATTSVPVPEAVLIDRSVLTRIADDMFARKGTPDAWSVNEVAEVLRGLASGDPEDLVETRWDDLFENEATND